MMPGFGSLGEAQLSAALDQICSAEGVTRDKLISVEVFDGEISVRHLRSNGLSRTSTYPIAALLPCRMARPVGPGAAERSTLETLVGIPRAFALAG